MSTKGIIDRALPWCPGWERSSGRKNLLTILQDALDELFAFDDDSMIYRGTDNQGFPPYLTTVSGTYDYQVIAANLSCGSIVRNIGGTNYSLTARKVNKIFIDTTSVSPAYFDTWIGFPYRTTMNPYCLDSTQSRIFIADVKISSQPGYENTSPTVKFLTDPGSHSDKYFIEFFVGPPRMLSESIQAPIPQRFEKDIVNYIIGWVQWMEHGRTNDHMQFFENVTKPAFRAEFGTAANTIDSYTPVRLC